MVKSMNEIIEYAKRQGRRKLAVAVAQDEDVLISVHQAYMKGLIDVCLVGDKEKIFEISDRLQIDISDFEIIKEADEIKAAKAAVELAGSGSVDMLMKGIIKTADLLRIVLDRGSGLRTDRLLSHISAIEVENYHKLLFITDGGLNIAPDVKQKAEIIQNAVYVANSLGIERPKVAVLASVEVVNPVMQATLDAAVLSKMADRGQIKNCIIDGPLAMDNAVSLEAARHKGIVSDVAGDADILVAPDIESGNTIQKALVFLGKAKSCGIIAGARVPLVVTSRADNYEAKLYSISLASIVSSLK